MKIVQIEIIGGKLYPYLKDIKIIGRVQDETGKLYIYGCKKGYEKHFYEGILEADNDNDKVLGFNTAKEAERFWMNGCDGMFLTVEEEDYEIIGVY